VVGHSRDQRTLPRDESSDMNVADGRTRSDVHVRGPKGERSIPSRLPCLAWQHATARDRVEPGDLITHVTLPPPAPGKPLALF